MDWFDRLFPVAMVIFPALILRSVRPHPSAAEDAPAKARRVYLLTALALILHVGVMVQFGTQQQERGGLLTAWVSGFSMAAFFVLWFKFTVPALAARHPGWGQVQRGVPVRSASLTPRHRDSTSMLPPLAWVFGWTLYVACVGVMAWSLAQGVHPTLVLGLMMWPGFLWGVRAVRTEAEPRDAGGSPELAEAYTALRRFRAWCFYWCGILGTVGMTVGAASAALDWAHSGTIAGVGGSLVGVLGGVMGTMASFRRARINGLLHDLTHQSDGGPA